MNQVLLYLEQLDLSESEAKLYMSLLQTGPISVRDLAIKVGIKRTTAYLYIDLLVEKGLVAKLVKGTQKLVAANDPEENLKELVTKKEKQIEEIKQAFSSISEIIKNNMSTDHVDSYGIKQIKGITGVRRIYEEALQSKELCTYTNLSEIYFPEIDEYFSEAFLKNPNLKIREILAYLPHKKNPSTIKNDRYLYKFMPSNVTLSTADVLIYDNKVAIINLNEKITGMVLNNSNYYKSSKEIFEYIWSSLPETTEPWIK